MRLSFHPITALAADLPGSAKEHILAILRTSLEAADPVQAIRRALVLDGDTLQVGTPLPLGVGTRSYDLSACKHIYVVGAGKASAAMAAALEGMLGERITAGWINVKDGYTAPTRRITIHEAGHPLPDARGVSGSQQIAALARQAGEKDLVICAISGGGSALMTLPVDGISLRDMEELTQALLRCGATINEMNAIRKHIEQLKGGQLSRLAYPARVIALILSDVIGSPLDVIASGPTSPDPSTFADAYAVLEKYELLPHIPAAVVRYLQEGTAGLVPETPKAPFAPGGEDPTGQSERALTRTQNVIIASNEQAAQAAVEEARRLGFDTLFLSSFLEGEAREVAKVLAALAREIAHSGQPVSRPACIVAGGETTVTVHGQGLGGRNQELALSAALSIAGLENVAVLSLGTDGSDGPTDASGAVATGRTSARAAAQGLQPLRYLADNDAYHFFQSLGDLIVTGPTNTNVNDLMFVFAF